MLILEPVILDNLPTLSAGMIAGISEGILYPVGSQLTKQSSRFSLFLLTTTNPFTLLIMGLMYLPEVGKGCDRPDLIDQSTLLAQAAVNGTVNTKVRFFWKADTGKALFDLMVFIPVEAVLYEGVCG